MSKDRLTVKQENFARDIANKKYKYIWQAYEANYDIKKSSQAALYVSSCRLLANEKVASRIEELEREIKAKEEVTLDESIVKIGQRINSDVRDYFNDDGSFKNPKDLTKAQASFLNSFEVVTTFKGTGEEIYKIEIKKVKFESWKDLLDMNIRRLGGYAKDQEGGVNETLGHLKDIINSAKGE